MTAAGARWTQNTRRRTRPVVVVILVTRQTAVAAECRVPVAHAGATHDIKRTGAGAPVPARFGQTRIVYANPAPVDIRTSGAGVAIRAAPLIEATADRGACGFRAGAMPTAWIRQTGVVYAVPAPVDVRTSGAGCAGAPLPVVCAGADGRACSMATGAVARAGVWQAGIIHAGAGGVHVRTRRTRSAGRALPIVVAGTRKRSNACWRAVPVRVARVWVARVAARADAIGQSACLPIGALVDWTILGRAERAGPSRFASADGHACGIPTGAMAVASDAHAGVVHAVAELIHIGT